MIEYSEVQESDPYDDTFEPDVYFAAVSNSEISPQNAHSLQNANDRIKDLTSDEFLIEAYNAATQLRNTFGDSDGLISDLSETIRMNILVVALSCRKHPTEMILAAIRTLPNDKQSRFLDDCLETLHAYKRSMESESFDDN